MNDDVFIDNYDIKNEGNIRKLGKKKHNYKLTLRLIPIIQKLQLKCCAQ